MNQKGGRRFFGQNRGKKDNFKGHQGKIKKKKLYGSKQKTGKIIDNEIASLQSRYSEIDSSQLSTFEEFPLSKKTLDGLKAAKYEKPTDIQRESLMLALKGDDILGAAKTGSGKTLAFLIPVLECLYRLKWSPLDGLGALIISPTRELAYQTFEAIRKVGKFHDFSAGLVIGGKLLKEEIGRINRTNIVICTPGRLLQHMDETVNFTADSLQMLVLDEADRILDMGFAQTMNAIIENLPPERQTLLFSATQTKSVKDLARLSLKDPMYVSVHEKSQTSTPTQLDQNYLVCELHDKISMLWSFVKNHLKAKVLVFLQSCKQVKFIHDCFRRLRPGVTLLALHGAMHQLKRVAVYNQFCRKKHAVLFATDIAARGLDFPAVHWVLQLDCPEDANTYIHRVGRTARYVMGGESLLVLMPSEEDEMVRLLEEKKIPIEKIKVNPKKLWSIQPKLASLCASDHVLKECAQRAFLSYLRSVFLMCNKKVFNVHSLDIESYSSSLGLAIAPRVRFLKREEKRRAEREAAKLTKVQKEKLKNVKSRVPPIAPADSESDSEEEEDSSGEESEEENSDDEEEMSSDEEVSVSSDEESDSDIVNNKTETKAKHKLTDNKDDLNKNKTKHKIVDKEDSSQSKKSSASYFGVDEDDEELFTVKPRYLSSSDEEEEDVKIKLKQSEESKKKETKYSLAKKIQKKNLTVNKKVVFDEEGQAVVNVMKESTHDKEEDDYEGGINIQEAIERQKEADKFDKQLHRQRIKLKHREERLKKKEMNKKNKKQQYEEESESGEEVEAVLDPGGDNMPNPLDFLPDPDKVYNSDSDSEGSDDDDEDSYGPQSKKQKLQHTEDTDDEDEDDESEEGSYKEEEDSGDEEMDDDYYNEMSLEDTEALAQKLLSSR